MVNLNTFHKRRFGLAKYEIKILENYTTSAILTVLKYERTFKYD